MRKAVALDLEATLGFRLFMNMQRHRGAVHANAVRRIIAVGRRLLFLSLGLLFWSSVLFAGGTLYTLRVDGLACPYCFYGIEKRLKRIPGVEAVRVDLKQGTVRAEVATGVRLTEPQMRRLFREAGFTFRGMTEVPR